MIKTKYPVPISEKSRFIDPLSCIVTNNRMWRISDIHPSRHRFNLEDIQYAIMFNAKPYRCFKSYYDSCIIELKKIFEDAAKIPKRWDGISYVMLDDYGVVRVQPEKSFMNHPHHMAIKIDPSEFLDDNTLLQDKIRDAVKDAYDKFMDVGFGYKEKY